MLPTAAIASAAAPQKRSLIVGLIIVALVLTLVLFLYFSGKKAGKAKASADKWGKTDWGAALKSNPTEIPHGWQPDGLAAELHDVMEDNFATGGDKEKVWAKLTALTDGQVLEVYKRFNERFAKKPETLTTWIKNEWYGDNATALAVLSKLNLP